MNFNGIFIGLCTFLIIGVFHPLVIKGYYYLGLKARWIFLAVGIVALAACVFVQQTIVSILLGVTSFSCFWSIKEVNEQKQRVARGWFPANPKMSRKDTCFTGHSDDVSNFTK
ncbi:MAG: DUF4491 family protein [Clostridiales bacterium]|nr:DUF4491 family protein [Clostridiales bacterium]